MLVTVRPAIAGFRCGPEGRPKPQGTIGCECPRDKHSARDGADWVCVPTPSIFGPPELKSPPADARDVDTATAFCASPPVWADELEFELCFDRACHAHWRSNTVPATDGVVSCTWDDLPLEHEMFWRVRGRKRGQPGAYSVARRFITGIRSANISLPELDTIERNRPAEDPRKAQEERSVEQERIVEKARKAEEARKADEAQRQPRRIVERQHMGEPVHAQQGAPPEQPDERPGRTLRLFGVGAGALGAVSLAAGIGFALHARALVDELSRPGATYDAAKIDAGNTANRIALVGFVTGGALVAVGVTLYWRGAAEGKRGKRVTLAPIVSDRFAGLVVSGALP